MIRLADWFSALGQPREGPFIIVGSWDEAIEGCGSPEWQDLILEATNRYREAVDRRNRERFQQWNSIVEDVRAMVLPLIERKVRPVSIANGLPKAVEDAVRWDLIHFGTECEFVDVFPPGFFAGQIYWYLQGRFPCGWKLDVDQNFWALMDGWICGQTEDVDRAE